MPTSSAVLRGRVRAPSAGRSPIGSVLLDIDTVSGQLVSTALGALGQDPADRDSVSFKITWRDPIYETLFDIARGNLTLLDVVIVGPFTREIRDPGWPVRLSAHLVAPVTCYYVSCSPAERRRRIEARGAPRDRAKLERWEEFLQHYGEELPPVFPHERILSEGT